MKNMLKVFAIIAMVAVIGLVTACPTDSGDGNPAEKQLSFVVGDYELIIQKSGAVPKTGDDYELKKNNKRISWGKIEIVGGGVSDFSTGTTNLTFKPAANAGSAAEFNANYTVTSTSGGLTITSNVTGEDGTTHSDLKDKQMTWGPAGTWLDAWGYEILVVRGTFAGGTWVYDGYNTGSYVAVGNTFVATYSSGQRAATAYLIDANTMSVSISGSGTEKLTRKK